MMLYDTTPRLCHGTEAFRVWTLWLGHRLAADGLADLEDHLVQVAAMSVALGVEPSAARLLADAGQPEIVRARAFFTVAVALDELAPTDPIDDALAA
ncbi:MAG: hypothetical protein ABW122_04735 [Ilumatobacteraceae bacterium]